MKKYDVAVIGTGPGGYVAAIRAAQMGAKTIVFEKEEVGGVCLNWGCIPTKTLIYTAELYRKLQKAEELGLSINNISLNLPALLKRKDAVIRRNKNGILSLFKAHGIELVKAEATLAGLGRIRANGDEIHANSVIIATGSSPAQIRGLETDGQRIITSTEALELEELPKKALVIGAGAIGAEFACLWNIFGVDVTLVEMLPRVLPIADEELSDMLAAIMRRRKMDVRTNTVVKRLDMNSNGVHVEFEGARTEPIDVDLVLVGIGRRYHSDVVEDAQGIHVKRNDRGMILVDEHMETNVPGIYAIGDVTGKTMLAHGASAEGLVAVSNALGKSRRMDYKAIPACTFTSPELAGVGLTEAKARQSGVDVKVGKFSYQASGRAATMGESDGLVKIVADARTDEVLGMHVIGPEAGELIGQGVIAMNLEATVAELAHAVQTHPTLSESVMEAAEDYYGMSIHTPPTRKGA
ncbi:MAG TPA: dihydrolipoyl dehydrogenase [Candidatus Hydrogenedentes bacterium]|nr:dihydrolipoyl dehydrogenase [Candidatus Hydrogenedentota bacterium]HOL75735.1 dihydrolipoyl dehydrogenase [Candidatus Hydrogenedentota bacterium]HPO84272.1 dihydrolipoyl dehydrogenase [Candidatus Hydrogenedentota bacterium]